MSKTGGERPVHCWVRLFDRSECVARRPVRSDTNSLGFVGQSASELCVAYWKLAWLITAVDTDPPVEQLESLCRATVGALLQLLWVSTRRGLAVQTGGESFELL